jgi:hypothetical protein
LSQIGQLSVLLNLKTGAFTGGIRRATGGLQTFSGQMAQVQRVASGMMGRLLALVGIGGGIAGLVAGVSRAAERVDALSKTADKLGIATEELAGFQHAAELTGVSVNQANTALQRMVRRIAEAAQGTGEAKKALEELGLSATALGQLSPDRQFRLIADAMSGVTSQADRVRLAMRLFDSEGVALVNTLHLGADGLDAMSEEARKLGLSLDRVDAAKVEMANDAITRMKSVFTGVFNQLAVHLAPVIEMIATKFTNAAAAGDGLGATTGNVVDYGVRAVGFFADSWQGLTLAFRAAQAGATWVFEKVVQGIDAVVRATQWWREVFSRSFDLIRSTWEQVGAGLRVMGQGIRVVFADFVAFIGRKLAEVVGMAADEAGVVSDSWERSMRATARRMSRSTGQAARDAQRGLDEAKQAALDAASATGAAWDALQRPITAEGSTTLQGYASALRELHGEQMQVVDGLLQQRLASDRVWEGYQRLKQQTEERAQAAAAAAPGASIPGLESEDPAIVAERTRQQHLEEMAQQHQDSLTGIYQQGLQEREKFAKQSAWAQTRTVLQALVNATGEAAKHSKTMFRIHKLASIGNAIISTAEGVTRALGSFPPPINFVMAGLVGAAGALQIAAIKNTQYGGGGSTPTVSAGIPSTGAGTGGGAQTSDQAPTSNRDEISMGGRNYSRQTLIVQGDVIRAEELERISKEARERNIVITEIRRA